MKRVRQFLIDYWYIIVGLVLFIVGVGGLVIMQSRQAVREGGSQVQTHVVKPVAKLPDEAAEPAATVAAASTACGQNEQGKLLLVSIAQQHIWACEGTVPVKESAVTTGASALTNVDDATPTGTFRIYSKQTNTTLKGCDVNGCWNDPVAYWMPFDDQVGFHDASWQTFPFGSSLYATQGSHGCVHLPLDFITWVYSWTPIGTTVKVAS
jgi:lipoprotein-anchoring transpeptidase ErfK/SrfK